MKEELKIIYGKLKDGKYHTSTELGKYVNISDKTCRKYIKELGEILAGKNIEIKSKARYGYILEGNILSENDIFFEKERKIPITSEERIAFLLERLICEEKYIKLEEISQEIYTSTKTLSNDMKKVEKIMEKYGLTLKRKPHYGIKLNGTELEIRNFLVDMTEKKLIENKFFEKNNKFDIHIIAKEIYTFLKNKNVKISDISLQNLVTAIYVTFNRVGSEKILEKLNVDKTDLFLTNRKNIEECVDYIKEKFGLKIELKEEDLNYITIHFLSNETFVYRSIERENIKEIKEIIEEILYYIKLTFKIDLFKDEELYKNLYTHILALTIRIRFGIVIKNPLLEEIKKNMPLEFNISTYICNLISNRYGKKLNEAEIGYIAVILHMSKVLNSNLNFKKNVLIVCPSGRGISKFLIHTYNNLFSEYSNLVSSCGVNELLDMNLETIDVIFTLVDINIKIDKPIYKINYFLNDEDIIKIKNILRNDESYIKKIIPRELFTYLDKGMEKEDVIEIMSKKLEKVENMSGNIKDLILQREELGMTEISKDIAIPHPIGVIEGVNVIGVCISKEPIKWINNEVNLVLFMCLDNKNNKNERVYEAFVKIFGDREILEEILENPTYDYFINRIENLGGNRQ